MNALKRYMHAVEKVNIFFGRLMVFIQLLTVFIISYEVVMRYAFNKPTNWAHESMTLLLGILYVALGGFCHSYRAHVRAKVACLRWAQEEPASAGATPWYENRYDLVAKLVWQNFPAREVRP